MVNSEEKNFIKIKRSRKIEYSISITNWYSFKIYLKFWAQHESRNQLKIWGKETLNVNLDNALDEIKRVVESNYQRWYSKEFLLQLYIELKRNISKIVEPVFIKKWSIENMIEVLVKDIEKMNVIQNKNTKKIIKKEKQKSFWNKSKFWIKIFKNRLINVENALNMRKKDFDENEVKLQNFKNKKSSYEIDIQQLDNKKIDWDSKYVQNIKSVNENLNYVLVQDFLKTYDTKKKIKGIYVIFNKDLNKYYVGQTKDIYKRICTQHFELKSGMCINKNFANDFNNGNKFYVYIKELNTKDELDTQEKYYINVFDAFNNGYNKTGGNI